MELFSGKPPTFQDFILASQRVGPDDALTLNGGTLEKKIPSEEKNYKKVWKAFENAVRLEFTSKQVKAIQARYGFEFDRKLPFKRRYVEYFGVAAASPYTFFLNERRGWFSRSLFNRTPSQIHNLVQKTCKNAFLGTKADPIEVTGSVENVHAQLTTDTFLNDQARSTLFRGISELTSKDPKIPRLHPYYSRLAMAIIPYIETDPENATLEAVIPCPGDREGELEYYRVQKIISGGGLNAITLVPISKHSKLEPLLVFRCTKQSLGHHGTFESNVDNFGEHIGKKGYEACAEELAKLTSDESFTGGEKFKVICYSQGGGHASYFMRDHWQKVSEYIAFNSVGSDAEVVKSVAEEINALDEDEIPPRFYQHRNVSNTEGTEGDWVNKTGQLHMGYGIKHRNAIIAVFEWFIHDLIGPTNNVWDFTQVGRWLDFHARRPMDARKENEVRSKWQNLWKYRYNYYAGPARCDPILDTYHRDQTLEDLRHKIGYKILYHLSTSLYKIVDFALRFFFPSE